MNSIIALVFLVSIATCAEYITITTPLGGLKGLQEEFNSKKIIKVLNIPYAKPPLGDLRFHDPIPFGAWQGTRAAYKFGHICPQDMLPEYPSKFFTELYKIIPRPSEDCLNLNIYVPNSIDPSSKKSVMVFIHGGGFSLGDGASYDGTELALNGDVIVVTIQHRLGVLGFFSTGDWSSSGNYGLKDQQLAFRWVHDYISYFGGDPDSVTIFGQSAGSISVALQALNPMNAGLFQRGIMQSGTSGTILSLCDNLKNVSTMFGIHTGCLDETVTEDTVNTQELMQCLRGLSTDAIVTSQLTLMGILMARSMKECFTGPVVDGDFFRKHPNDILQDPSSKEMEFFKTLDIIVGTTSLEGALYSAMFEQMEESMNYTASEGVPDDVVCMLTKSFAGILYEEERAGDILCEKMLTEDKIEQGVNFIKFTTDAMFTLPTMITLSSHADSNDNGRTYQYLFSFEFENDFVENKISWLKGKGSSHGSELLCMFGPEGFLNIFKDNNELQDVTDCKHNWMTYLTNFAKTGNPDGEGLPSWPQFSVSEKQYLNIGPKVQVENNLFKDRMTFLMETVPSLLQQPTKDEL